MESKRTDFIPRKLYGHFEHEKSSFFSSDAKMIDN